MQSSLPAGTVLKGLNFFKDKQDPVAMADEEYPAWLWKVLDKSSGEAGGAKVDEGDLYGMFSLKEKRQSGSLVVWGLIRKVRC